MPWPPTTTQILDLAEGGVYLRADRFRFDLEDFNKQVIGELSPDLEQTPTLTNDTTRTVFRSVSNLRLPPAEAADINTLTDRVAIWMVLQDRSDHPLGRYLFADETHPLREWGAESHSVLVDLTDTLDEDLGRTSGSVKGSNCVQRAVDFARYRGGWPANEIDFVNDTTLVATPMDWTANDKILAIINEHLDLAGYFHAYVNHAGELVFRPMPDTLDQVAPDLAYNRGGRIVADSRSQSNDLLHAPNEYVAVDTSGQGSPIIGRYRISEANPHSVGKRHRVIRKVESMQGLTSTAAADKAARNLAIKDKRNTFDWQTWTTPNDPRHDTFNIIELEGLNHIEVAWTMQLIPTGTMEHSARRPYF
jgi:hypothetical protein